MKRRLFIGFSICLGCYIFPVQAESFAFPTVEKNEISQQGRRLVQGIVKDVKGEPIIGASVVEVGTTNGTATDIDGLFSLQVSEG